MGCLHSLEPVWKHQLMECNPASPTVTLLYPSNMVDPAFNPDTITVLFLWGWGVTPHVHRVVHTIASCVVLIDRPQKESLS